MTKVVASMGLLVALCLPSAAMAQFELGDQNQLLTITGQVSADQKAAENVGYDAVSISFRGQPADKIVWLGVVRAETWNDDAFAGKTMVDNLDGYTPSFMADGKPALVTKIQQAAVGSRLVMQGMLDTGTRQYLVGTVQVIPAGGSK